MSYTPMIYSQAFGRLCKTDALGIPTNCEAIISQFLRTESWLVESPSRGDVLEDLVILNARIGTATQTEHLPTCHSI